jgi:hypothetical protein
MNLEVVVEDHVLSIAVPATVLAEAEEFFAKMDRDMDRGWQMSREWVDAPTPLQRCQIAADRLYTALSRDDKTLAMLMAGYIVSRQPDVRRVVVNTDGDIQDTEIILAPPT